MKTRFRKLREDRDRQPLLPLFQEMQEDEKKEFLDSLVIRPVENDDNDRLYNMQVRWLKYGDEKSHEAMWNLCREIAGKRISMICKARSLRLSASYKDEVAWEAVMNIMARFGKFEFYGITQYVSQIFMAVQQAMDTQKPGDRLLKKLYGMQGNTEDIPEILGSLKKEMEKENERKNQS